MLAARKPVAAVCHAPGVLRHVKTADGQSVAQGRAVTGFTNTEEQAAGLTAVVPFLVEDMLKKNGGTLFKGSRLATACRHRWLADHRPEPGVVRAGCEGIAENVGVNQRGRHGPRRVQGSSMNLRPGGGVDNASMRRVQANAGGLTDAVHHV